MSRKLDWMRKAAAIGKMSRRDFVQLALAAGLTAGMAETMFSTAVRAMPKKGGNFINALTGGGTKDVLDPAHTLDSYMINVSMGQLRNGLTEIAPDGSLRGELAESWEAADSGKTWRFKLRGGVTFHNGSTFDANDVVTTFAVQWDAKHPLHVGKADSGLFDYWTFLFAGFLPARPTDRRPHRSSSS